MNFKLLAAELVRNGDTSITIAVIEDSHFESIRTMVNRSHFECDAENNKSIKDSFKRILIKHLKSFLKVQGITSSGSSKDTLINNVIDNICKEKKQRDYQFAPLPPIE